MNSSYFKKFRKPRNFDVSVNIHLFGDNMHLSVPITATKKSEAKRLATDLVQKKIIVTATDCRKLNF